MKRLGVKAIITSLVLGLSISLALPVAQSAASENVTYTAEQLKEIERAKKRTEQELKQPSKKFDLKRVQAEAKRRNMNVNQLVQKQEMGAMAGSIGKPGDILVTLKGKSSSSFAWAGGHAGIVSDVSGYVVESFGNKGDLNGVRHWPNDWATRYSHVRGLWVSGANTTHYNNAAAYARSQIGKPYNYNFFNVSTTNSFYCSQLVWRAWYNQGWDLNDGLAVWPVDLVESPHTIIFYSKG